MPVNVYWEDADKSIVRYDFEASWTWDELYAAYYEAIAMETSVTYRVDVILDMRRSNRIPANALLHVKNLSEKQPPNIGVSIFVTTNTFIISMVNMAIKAYKKIAFYFRLVNTLESAHEIIATARQRVPEGKLSP
jgi:hypothetical protein